MNANETRKGQVAVQDSRLAFKERSASGVVDTLRTESRQGVLSCHSARHRLSRRSCKFLEPLSEVLEVDLWLFGWFLLLLQRIRRPLTAL